MKPPPKKSSIHANNFYCMLRTLYLAPWVHSCHRILFSTTNRTRVQLSAHCIPHFQLFFLKKQKKLFWIVIFITNLM